MPLATSRARSVSCLIGSFPGTSVSARVAVAGAGVRSRRRDSLQPQRRGARAGRRARRRRRGARAAAMPAWVSIDQEGGRVARLKEPFTRWPPMAVLGRAGSEALAERFGRALARELTAVGITLDYAPVLDIHTNPKNPGDRRSRACREGRRSRAARRASSFARCRARAWRRAASTFPGTATPAPIRTSSCRWSSIRRIGCAPWSSSRSARPFASAWRSS